MEAIDRLVEYVDRCTDHDSVLLSDPPQHRVYGVREDFDRLIGAVDVEMAALIERGGADSWHIGELESKVDALSDECDVLRHERDELQRKLADLSEDRGFVPATDEEMAKHGWTRLPSDMDGMPICVGDKIEHAKRRGVVTAICRTYAFSSISVLFDGDEKSETVMPYEVLHCHEPTVADVLREFAAAWDEWKDGSPHDPFAKYAKLLQLKGE